MKLFYKPRFKNLLKKKGLTLVEILVVLVISSMLIGVAVGMFNPVTRLLNSLKGNAHLDAMSNTINEYIRGELQTSQSVCIIPYPNNDAVINKSYYDYLCGYGIFTKEGGTYKFNKNSQYQVRALGVLSKYGGGNRIYNFGDVSNINYRWGSEIESENYIIKTANSFYREMNNALKTLIDNRGGGGTALKKLHKASFADGCSEGDSCPSVKGVNDDSFQVFDAFNNHFYNNGLSEEALYYPDIAFEIVSRTKKDEKGSVKPIQGVNFITVSTQIREDKTKNPINQNKTISFKLLNGTAEIKLNEKNVDKIENADGTTTTRLTKEFIILYVTLKD